MILSVAATRPGSGEWGLTIGAGLGLFCRGLTYIRRRRKDEEANGDALLGAIQKPRVDFDDCGVVLWQRRLHHHIWTLLKRIFLIDDLEFESTKQKKNMSNMNLTRTKLNRPCWLAVVYLVASRSTEKTFWRSRRSGTLPFQSFKPKLSPAI